MTRLQQGLSGVTRANFGAVVFWRRRSRRSSALESDDFDTLARSRGYVKARSQKDFSKLAKSRGYTMDLPLSKILDAQRFAVDEVIDVGVHAGTQWLYEQFPAASFVLVEPIPDAETLLKWKPETYTYVNCGLGAQPGQLTLNRYHNEKLNSFLEIHNIAKNVPQRRQLAETVDVPIRTLDDTIEEYCTSDNIGVKIDTEGFELEVVRGLEKHKERVSFIIAECSVVRRHHDSYQFSDLVAELRAKDFYFLNVMNPLQTTAQFYDAIFVHGEDPRLWTPVDRIAGLEEQDRAAREKILSRRP
jgi:FkbM family methyltransferase